MQRQSSITFNGLDIDTPVGEKLCGQFMRTFAYTTIKDRLPVIITKIVDQIARDKEEIIQRYGEDAEECVKVAIGKLSKLKNEVQTNKPFVKIETDASDVDTWNAFLKEMELLGPVAWFTAPWLYAETYLYRRIQEIFEASKSLTTFDPFRKQKEEALDGAIDQFSVVFNTLQRSKENESKCARFAVAIKLSLWSNRCDLSLSNGTVDMDESSALANIDALSKYILTDHTLTAFHSLQQSASKIIDIVHDNAAYELFSDFCLAQELLDIGLGTTIRLRVKKFPWYVSDATRFDVFWLLDKLKKSGYTDEATRWQNNLDSGRWQIITDDYWTLPFPYCDMENRDSSLYSSLAEAALIIFKGDLNYRKLVGDINWSYSTRFSDALQGFQPTNILSLRTIKADVACNLPEDIPGALSKDDPLWMRTGNYATIQLSQRN